MILTETPVLTPAQVLRLPQDPTGVCWWLLWTQPKRENRLARAIADAGATPLIITNVREKPRTNGAGRGFTGRSEVSVFNGYVFANGTAECVFEAKRFHAAQLVEIRQQSKTARQIADTMELSASTPNLTVVNIAPGTEVEIIRGAWKGKRGSVRENRQGFIYFDIDVFGRATEIEIDPEWVEPV